jgi:hypothetical protein
VTAGVKTARAEYERLTAVGFPRRFPIAQFPNPPLIAALAAGVLAQVAHGATHDYARSVAELAIGVWAYEELAHGVNWFRRLLGATFAILTIVRVANALHR